MKLNEIHYAIIDVDGNFVSGDSSKTNGLYSSLSRAKTFINSQIKHCNRALDRLNNAFKDNIESEIFFGKRKFWEDRIKQYESHKIIPVKVVEVKD
jgi:hypothetical protein